MRARAPNASASASSQVILAAYAYSHAMRTLYLHYARISKRFLELGLESVCSSACPGHKGEEHLWRVDAELGGA